MGLRDSLSPAVEAVHPALFLVGLAIAGAQSGLGFLQAAVEPASPVAVAHLLNVGGPFLVLVATTPLLVGLYVPVRERTATTGATLRTAAGAVRRHYRGVFIAAVAAVPAALGVALAVSAVGLAAVTGVQFLAYTVGGVDPLSIELTFLAARLGFAAALAVGVLAVRFADVFVVFGSEHPLTAWRSSLSFARRRPVAFAGYAVAMVVLLGTSQVLPFVFTDFAGPAEFAAFIGAIVLVGGVGTTLASAVHVTYFERAPGATADAARSSVDWFRVAAAFGLLLATAAGTGFVRLEDPGTGQDEIEALPDDPERAYAVAADNTRDANHRMVVELRNVSAGDSGFRNVSWRAVDYDTRRLYVYLSGESPGERIGGFHGEGTVALPSAGYAWRATLPSLSRQSGGWTVVAAPGYAVVGPDSVAVAPIWNEGWSLTAANESALVYRVDGPEAVDDAPPADMALRARETGSNSTATVVVDRASGVLDYAQFSLYDSERGHVYEQRFRYEGVGSTRVERPAALGRRSLGETLWDVLYY